MNLVKYQLVDSVTGEFTNNQPTKNGLSAPNIDGLECKVHDGLTFYGTCADTVTSVLPPAQLLNQADMTKELSALFTKLQSAKLEKLNKIAIAKRNTLISNTYHSSELTAGLVKYQQAQLATAATTDTNADTIAPQLAVEAKVRGITTKALAAKVEESYTTLMTMEAQLSGYHGKLADTINALVFDTTILFDNFINLNKIELEKGWPV
jgi:hypothetical protein